jgi:DNA-binding NtrC family response regulator
MARLDSVWVVDDDESIRWVLEKGFTEDKTPYDVD